MLATVRGLTLVPIALTFAGCILESGPLPERDASAPIDAAVRADGRTTDAMAASSCLDVHAGALFCEGFEDPQLPAWGTPEAGISQVATPAYRGAGALRAEATGAEAEVRLTAVPFAPRASGDVYTRSWHFVPADTEVSHVEMLGVHNSGGVSGLAILVFDGELRAFLAGTGNVATIPGPLVPKDTWFCVESHIEIGAAGSVQVWLDGVSTGQTSGVDTLPGTGIDRIVTGIPFTGQTQVGTAEVFIDELVIDDQPIGCGSD